MLTRASANTIFAMPATSPVIGNILFFDVVIKEEEAVSCSCPEMGGDGHLSDTTEIIFSWDLTLSRHSLLTACGRRSS